MTWMAWTSIGSIPGLPGAGHPYRAEDKQNFTALLAELRGRFDAEAKKTHRRLYLTIAMGAGDDVIAHTEMRKVARYVDTVNLMTYDYYEAGSDATTGHHAPMFANPADPKKASSEETVRDYETAGVPAEKILLGVPFYGREWGDVPDAKSWIVSAGRRQLPGCNAPVQRNRVKHMARAGIHALLGRFGEGALFIQRGEAYLRVV